MSDLSTARLSALVPGRGIVSFIAAQLCLLSVLVGLRFAPEARSLLAPLEVSTAAVAAELLQMSGLSVFRDGRWLGHADAFALVVDYRCTGLPVILWLTVGLWALPGRGGRLRFALACALLVLVLNQIRLVSLFWIGLKWPDFFELAHLGLWESVMLALAPVGWWFWLREAFTQSRRSSSAPRPPFERALSMRSSRLSILRRWARVFSS